MAARTGVRPYGALGRIGIVAAMHVGAFYLIAASLGVAPPLKIDNVVARFIEDPPDIIDTPPPLDPVVVTANVPLIPAPELPPIEQDAMPEGAITAEVRPIEQIPVQQPGSALPQPVVVAPQVDPRRPLSRPPYPPEVIRQNGEGSAVIEILVLENGRVGDVRIVKSSGFEALDRATMAEARRNWRLKPATRDGVAIQQWHRLSVAFRLEDR